MLSALDRFGLRHQIGWAMFLHAAILVGLVVVVIVIGGPGSSRTQVFRLAEPDDVASMADAFEQTPRPAWQVLANALSHDEQRVAIMRSFPPEASAADGEVSTPANLAPIEGAFATAVGPRPLRVVAQGATHTHLASGMVYSTAPLRVYIGLRTGDVMEVERLTSPPVGRWLANMPWLLATMLFIDGALVFWLAGLTKRPVDRLLQAVRKDDFEGMNLGGPRELAELGRAFRDLRANLHRLLEERTRMLAAIAHDYRTYLTRLELRADYIADERQRALASADIEEMNLLLDDTLTFAEQTVEGLGDVGRTDARAELEVIEADRQMLGQNITLSLGGGDLTARLPRIAFQRIVANLIDNAVQYGKNVEVCARSGDEAIVVTILDDGPGVPEDRIGDLTEPFLRLDESRARHTGGAGLGLSIVKALADRHNVSLALENREEGGFRVRLWLPTD